MRSVYAYTDYRKFLTDFYNHKKKSRTAHGFSYQTFAEKAGFKSKVYLYQIMTGKKALSKSSIFCIANAMGLTKREVAYFEALVRFNEARTAKEREHYFGQLQLLGRNHSAVALRQDQFSYFSEWHNVVLRELVTMEDFHDDFAALAKAVSPPITTKQAKSAVELLLRLGLLRKSNDGKYEHVSRHISMGEYIDRFSIHKFQKATMQLASTALDRFPKEDRDISSLTLGLSRAAFDKIRNELAEFRRHIAETAATDDQAERVVQINLQMFPVSSSVNAQ